jgi:tetratricopeptide (TPR) repeat protein
MKKLVLTLGLCFMVSATFWGQKKVLNDAKNEIKRDNPNMEDARNFIKAALEDPETKDNPEAWYVAGTVENKQLDMELVKEFKGQAADDELRYAALLKIIPYFEKADALDQLPNEKGKVKPKYRKDMKAIITANIYHYPNAGIYYYGKEDFNNAFLAFKQYVDIPDLEMFKGDDKLVVKKDDDAYLQIKYNAATMASMLENHAVAIEMMESMKNSGYEENEIFRRLTYEYNQTADSVALINILKEGVVKFPNDEYFLLNLIDKSIQANRLQEAVSYINLAIEQNPSDPILYDALGVIYENTNEPEKSIQSYAKALEIDPNYAKALKHTGMVYYNLAVKARANSDELSSSDKKLSEEAFEQGIKYFKESLPFFEKAYEIEPTDRETIFCLRSVYYSLGMDEFEKMDAIYTKILKDSNSDN